MHWKWSVFSSLTAQELYNILALRQEVFVVEQKCLYQDLDYKDQHAHHLLGFDKSNQLVAYLRLFPHGIVYPDAISFGRVLTSNSVRGKGYAKQAMKEVEKYLEKNNWNSPIIISAQLYLKKFYEDFGFLTEGTVYNEDLIPHIKMMKR